MLRLLKYGWIATMVLGGLALALVSLVSHDLGSAAVMTGISLTGALAAAFLPDETSSRKSGFQPHRKG